MGHNSRYTNYTSIIYASIPTSLTYFLASVGGFFGFCLGGSILSIVELIYLFLYGFFKSNTKLKNKTKVGFTRQLQISEVNIYQIYHKKCGKKKNITFITLPNVQGTLGIEKVS